MFETARRDGVLQAARPGARWLATGLGGGFHTADAAYNITVPEEFDRTDIEAYGTERRKRAGFEVPGSTMLTGVEQRHARGATCGPVRAVVTAGVSNPATLPMNPGREGGSASDGTDTAEHSPGTVNVILGVERALDAGALATLLGGVIEAKTATLSALTGFTGTTTDAVVVGCVPSGEVASFAGSATAVGEAARACVREALRASLSSRYPDGGYPDSVADADHGVRTTRTATVFEP